MFYLSEMVSIDKFLIKRLYKPKHKVEVKIVSSVVKQNFYQKPAATYKAAQLFFINELFNKS